MEDIWSHHSDLIKRLYQGDRRSLKDVKKVLESQHGFPQNPLSTYETKLRDVLKLRKKLRKEDWRLIHFYTLKCGYKKKEYEVYLNGTLIPWDKTWKEVRRSGALQSETFDVHEVDLPRDVMVVSQTRAAPYPTAKQGSRRALRGGRLSADPAVACSRTSPPPRRQSATVACPRTVGRSTRPSRCHQAQCCHKGCNVLATRIELIHDVLPWNRFRQSILSSAKNGEAVVLDMEVNGIVMSYMPQDGFFPDMHEMVLARVSDTIYPSMWNVYERCPSSELTSPRRFWYRHLSMLTYILSNRIHDESDGIRLFDLLGMVMVQLPAGVISKAFKEGHLSLRALWDCFVSEVLFEVWFHVEGNQGARLKLDAVAQVTDLVLSMHPEWVEDYKDELLCLVSLLGRTDLVQRLLRQNARLILYHHWEDWTAISAATMSGVTGCVEALVGSCDINTLDITRKNGLPLNASSLYDWRAVDDSDPLPVYDYIRPPCHFTAFLRYFWSRPQDTRYDQSAFIKTLKMLIEAGADIHAVYPLGLSTITTFYPPDMRPEWRPTCADMAYYLCKHSFAHMHASKPRVPPHPLSRAGVCEAVQQGRAALDRYLHSVASYTLSEKELFLEVVLVEQFFIRQHKRCADLNLEGARVARGLLECGVAIRQWASDETLSLLLGAWVASVDEYGWTEDLAAILTRLAEERLVITADILVRCVEHTGVQILSTLQSHGVLHKEHMASLGAEALMQAVGLKNNEAVCWLLDNGLDVNVEHEGITAIGFCLMNASWTVCEDLVRAGAKLRSSLRDTSCYELLKSGLLYGSSNCMETFRFLQAFPDEMRQVAQEEWDDLFWSVLRHSHEIEPGCWRDRYGELCEHLFHHFINHSKLLSDSSILSAAIRAPASPTLIQRLLEHGADMTGDDEGWGSPICAAIQMRQFQLVRQLLDLGADINTPVKSRGGNALCRICHLRVSSRSDKLEKMDFLRYLIDMGVDVNGGDRTSAAWTPLTPLQICAMTGDVEAASILLQHQADLNLLRHDRLDCGHFSVPSTALDLAVKHERLDMAQLLLRAGGLSAEPGLTGYEGCIKTVKRHGNGAMAALIRQHMSLIESQIQESSTFKNRHEVIVGQVLMAEKSLRELSNFGICGGEGPGDDGESYSQLG